MTVVAHSESVPSVKMSSAFSRVFLGLALAFLTPAAADAGADRMASLQLPPIEASPDGFERIDLAALETKISNTDAIDFLDKIRLKSGIDSLTEAFGRYHKGESARDLGALRHRFEDFLYSTVAMLRAGDPSLARELALSREALWKILTDPDGAW
jgi:hypothetical protein